VLAARLFLKELNLDSFRTGNEQQFRSRLNTATKHLKDRLPRKARNWGAARKAINIFLRDALYNHYLRSRYRLDRLEGWLEVPLDRNVAMGLCAEPEGVKLPRWKSIKSLTEKREEISLQYQAVANKVARRKRTQRVHLDLYYFRRKQAHKV
jgi:hypothetical protein